jgi:phosphohistidine phosphatase
MNLYLMRHAHALDVGEAGIKRDRDRPLSRKGTEIAREVAQFLTRHDIKLDLIATSPLVRARQTAGIIAGEQGDIPLEICPAMAPAELHEDILHWLHHCPFDSVMLVGHMPDLSELASVLICKQPPAGLAFKKAAVCRIVFDHRPTAGHGALEWLLPPSLI